MNGYLEALVDVSGGGRARRGRGDHAIELFKADLMNNMGNLGCVNAEELAERLAGD